MISEVKGYCASLFRELSLWTTGRVKGTSRIFIARLRYYKRVTKWAYLFPSLAHYIEIYICIFLYHQGLSYQVLSSQHLAKHLEHGKCFRMLDWKTSLCCEAVALYQYHNSPWLEGQSIKINACSVQWSADFCYKEKDNNHFKVLGPHSSCCNISTLPL